MKRAKIIGTGSYLPQKILTNKDLEKMVNTSDEWITTRTGIKKRRINALDEATSDLGTKAALNAIKSAGINPKKIDLIINASFTPDFLLPSSACLIGKNLGLAGVPAFDLSAACSGFVYGLSVAEQFIISQKYKMILVISAESLSRVTNWKDRETCILFGDGAGAAILTISEDGSGIISNYLGADGNYWDLLYIPAGGSRLPASKETVENNLHYMKMRGNEVFKIAVNSMIESAKKALSFANLESSEIDLLIPHQANIRIIQAVAKRLKIPEDKVFVNISEYGNISGATISVGLDEAVKSKRIKSGNLVELVAFGGGFTWGATVIKW